MPAYSKNFDWLIVLTIIILLLLGLAIVGSVAPAFFFYQALYAFLGFLFFFLVSRIDYRIFARFTSILFFLTLLALFSTFVFGQLTRGSIRWIQIGVFTFQPSELVKPFLILIFASFFSSHESKGLKSLAISLLLLFLPVLLIFRQPDLGSSLVVIFLWGAILFSSGLSWPWLASGFLFIGASLPLLWRFLKSYQKERIFTFLNPLTDPLGAGYNMIQSVVAVGSGQLFGRGLGRGTQSHLRFLPERHTDFIFASLAEELGFLGSALLIFAYALLLWRILRLGQKTADPFGSLICVGTFTLIFSQAFINISMNLGLLPITGLTLPLVSYGGSSLLATMISLGLVESVARLTKPKVSLEIR
jgi:rod shape determining protein RodA